MEHKEKLSIDLFLSELKTKILNSNLNVEKLNYDILKDGTYNFTYYYPYTDSNCQIGRIKLGKRSSKMQILTCGENAWASGSVIWLENLTMEEYIKNIDKWIFYIKETKRLRDELNKM